MSRLSSAGVLAAVVVGLLSTTAVSAADLQTVTQTEPYFSLTETGGIIGFHMPDQPSGVFANGGTSSLSNASGIVFGGQLGLSAGAKVGSSGDLDFLIGVNAFVAGAKGTVTTTDTFSGPGVVVIPGYTTPSGSTIALATSNTGPASGTSTVIIPGANNAVGGSNTGGGANDVTGVSPGSNGFAFGATSAAFNYPPVPNTGAAYGAAATTDGSIFIGSGDLAGLKITTSTTHNILYTGADITFTASGKPQDGVVIQAYAGPSYRYLHDDMTSKVSADIPEIVPNSPNPFPTYSLNRDEILNTHYTGGIVGVSGSHALNNGWVLTVNAEGGFYYARTDMTGTEFANVTGSTFDTSVSTASVPVNQTAVNANGISGSDNGTAFAGRLQAVMSTNLDNGMQLSLGGSVEYLSRVAYVDRVNDAVTTGSATAAGSTASYAGGGTAGPGATSTLAFGDMWDFGITASLTQHF